MMQMASGADYVSGTFTAPSDVSTYTIEFGKTFNAYMFFIEATDESKTSILNSGLSGGVTYSFMGVYPRQAIGNNSGPATFVSRISPSTNTQASTYLSQMTLSDHSITRDVGNMTANSFIFYSGLTYNYYIFEIK